ncbi:MAG TPA: hypothetical protein VM261_11275 [Kofleriaceae bacterium]|nr:hypothetical protein [Kofleriaceae bacterium]
MAAQRTRGRRSTKNRRLVLIELKTSADVEAHWNTHLKHGGAYGPPGGRAEALVTLMIVGPAAMPFELPAKTVYVGAEGTGYEITGFNAALKSELFAWMKANIAEDAAEHAPTTKMPKFPRDTKK